MADIAGLRIQVTDHGVREATGNIARLHDTARRTEDAVDRLGDEAQETGRQTERMGRGAQAAAGGLRMAAGAAAAFVAALGVRQIAQTADAVEQLRGRINLYTASAQETEAIMGELFDRARQLGAEFGSLAEIYARMAPTQQQLNLSTSQMLDLTEAIGSAFLVSGASAQEADNAIRQLSQAFASGELRGEELRSVMEQGQRVMLALGEQTGKTTGELRRMAEQGELTADVVANALLAELPKLRQEMEDLPVTLGRGMASLRSAIAETVGTLNTMTGATQGIGEMFQGWADAIGEFNDRLNAASLERFEQLGDEIERLAELDQSFAQRIADAYLTSLAARAVEGAEALSDLATIMEGLPLEVQTRLARAFNSELEVQALQAAQANAAFESYAEFLEGFDFPEREALSFASALERINEAAGFVSGGLAAITERLPEQRGPLSVLSDLWEATPDLWEEAGERAAELAAQARELAEAQDDLRQSTEDEIKELERLLDALADGESAYIATADAIARENEVRAAGLDIASEAGQEMLRELERRDELIGKIDATRQAHEDEADAAQSAKEARERAYEDWLDDLEDIRRQTERTADQVSDLIAQGMFEGFDTVLPKIERMLVSWAANLILRPIIQPIVAGMGGFGGMGGMGGMAQLGGSPLGFLTNGGFAGGGGGGMGGFGLSSLMGGFYDASINMAGLGAQAGYGLSNLLGLGQGATATLGNIGSTIGAAGPGALIGSTLARLLGAQGSGNALIDGGLSLGGSVLGGMVGGPIGSAIGAALGQALAGVFRDEDYPYARADFAIRNGRAVQIGGETLDGGSLQGAESAIADAINAALGQLGVGSDFTGGGTTFGVASGRSGALGSGFFAGAGGGFSGGATYTRLSPEEAAKRAVAFALSQAVGAGAIQLPDQMQGSGPYGSQFDAAMGIFERNDFDVDAALADLNFAQNFEDALASLEGSTEQFGDSIRANVTAQIEATLAPLREFSEKADELGLASERSDAAIRSFVEGLLGLTEGESLNAAEQAIAAVNAKFDALAEAAAEFGISVERVEQGRENALSGLTENFMAGLEAASLQATGQGFILEGRSLFDQIDALREQAITYGEGFEEVDQLGRDLLRQMLTGLSADEIVALSADLGSRAAEYQDVFLEALNGIGGDGGVIDTSTEALDRFMADLRADVQALQEQGPGGEIARIAREYREGIEQASAFGVDGTLLGRRGVLSLQRVGESIGPDDFEAVRAELDTLPPGLSAAGDALRAYMDAVDDYIERQEAATEAQQRAAEQAEFLRGVYGQLDTISRNDPSGALAGILRDFGDLTEQADALGVNVDVTAIGFNRLSQLLTRLSADELEAILPQLDALPDAFGDVAGAVRAALEEMAAAQDASSDAESAAARQMAAAQAAFDAAQAALAGAQQDLADAEARRNVAGQLAGRFDQIGRQTPAGAIAGLERDLADMAAEAEAAGVEVDLSAVAVSELASILGGLSQDQLAELLPRLGELGPMFGDVAGAVQGAFDAVDAAREQNAAAQAEAEAAAEAAQARIDAAVQAIAAAQADLALAQERAGFGRSAGQTLDQLSRRSGAGAIAGVVRDVSALADEAARLGAPLEAGVIGFARIRDMIGRLGREDLRDLLPALDALPDSFGDIAGAVREVITASDAAESAARSAYDTAVSQYEAAITAVEAADARLESVRASNAELIASAEASGQALIDAAQASVDGVRARVAEAIEAERREAAAAQARSALFGAVFDAERSRILDLSALRAADFDNQIAALRDQARAQNEAASERRRQLEAEAQLFARAADQIDAFARGLSFESFSPVPLLEQLQEARTLFDETARRARGGDAEAAARLTQDAERLLGLNAQVNRSGEAGGDLFAEVRDTLNEVGGVARSRGGSLSASAQAIQDASTAEIEALERQRQAAEDAAARQIEELRALLGLTDDGFNAVRDAIRESTAASLAAGGTLESFLGDNAELVAVLRAAGFDDPEGFISRAFEAAQERANIDAEREDQIAAAEQSLLDAQAQATAQIEAAREAAAAALEAAQAALADAQAEAEARREAVREAEASLNAVQADFAAQLTTSLAALEDQALAGADAQREALLAFVTASEAQAQAATQAISDAEADAGLAREALAAAIATQIDLNAVFADSLKDALEAMIAEAAAGADAERQSLEAIFEQADAAVLAAQAAIEAARLDAEEARAILVEAAQVAFDLPRAVADQLNAIAPEIDLAAARSALEDALARASEPFDEIPPTVEDFFEGLASSVDVSGDMIGQAGDAAADNIEDAGDALGDAVRAVIGNLAGTTDLIDEVGGSIEDAIDAIEDARDAVITNPGFRDSDPIPVDGGNLVATPIPAQPYPVNPNPIGSVPPPATGGTDDLVDEIRRLRQDLTDQGLTGNRLSAAMLDQLVELGAIDRSAGRALASRLVA